MKRRMRMIEAYIIRTPTDSKRAERLEQEFERQLQTMGDRDINISYFKAFMDPQMPRRGISKTHRAIVQEAADKGLSEVLIVEDDIKFLNKESLLRFLNINRYIPKDCDMFFGGIYDGKIEKEFSAYASVIDRISGLHCYIVKQKFYEKFLSADPNFNLDFYLSEYLKPMIYCAYPMLAIQHDGYSYNAGQEMKYNRNLHKKYKLIDGN